MTQRETLRRIVRSLGVSYRDPDDYEHGQEYSPDAAARAMAALVVSLDPLDREQAVQRWKDANQYLAWCMEVATNGTITTARTADGEAAVWQMCATRQIEQAAFSLAVELASEEEERDVARDWRAVDWDAEYASAKKEWRTVLGK